MKLAFGYEVKSENDYYLQLAEESMKVGSLAAAPGRWLVDSFPIRKYQHMHWGMGRKKYLYAYVCSPLLAKLVSRRLFQTESRGNGKPIVSPNT